MHIKPGGLGPWRRLQQAQQAGILFRQHLAGGLQQRQVKTGGEWGGRRQVAASGAWRPLLSSIAIDATVVYPQLRRLCSLFRSAGGQEQHHPASQPAQRPGTVRLPASEHCKESIAMVVTA